MAVFVGSDIGGTFTDVVGFDSAQGKLYFGKQLTNRNDLAKGVLDCLENIGLEPQAIDLLKHGTTQVINTLLERRGARTALVTTEGFRDLLEIGRAGRPVAFQLDYEREPPLVERELRFEIDERIDAHIELEMGFFIGKGNALGDPIQIEEASEQIFGFCLLNDWSARDIQRWEMFPLGPFLGKNFGTTISPWVVTTHALAPFRVPAMQRPPEDPTPLPYLFSFEDQSAGGLNADLEVRLSTVRMREAGKSEQTIIRSNSQFLYWTPAQMVTHHTSGGCNLASGDLLGTGTISGPDQTQLSSLLELTTGANAFAVGDDERRIFLEDGDLVVFRGRCKRQGFREIGFGECTGEIVPALQASEATGQPQ